MVFYIRRGGVQWALWTRVLHAPAEAVAVVGRAAAPDPLVGVRACTLGGPGDSVRACRAPLSEGHVMLPNSFPSGRRVRTVGVGRIVTGAVPSLSHPASQVPQCCHILRDGRAVTGVGGWNSGHNHCGEWRPDAILSWALWRSGWHSMPPYDGRVSGRAVCLLRRGVASSETEMIRPTRG